MPHIGSQASTYSRTRYRCHRGHSELLSKQEALKTILPHCLLVYDPDVARQEFVALTQLVQQTDCYRLHFGRDVLDLLG